MEKFLVEFNEYEPKYIQIANNIKKLINDKDYEAIKRNALRYTSSI